MTFAEKMKQGTPTPAPEGWKPLVDIGPDGGTITTQANTAVINDSTLPEGEVSDMSTILTQHGLSPDQWKITSFRKGSWQSSGGEWLYAWKLTVAPTTVFSAMEPESIMPDLHDLEKSLAYITRGIPSELNTNSSLTVVGVLADAQVGKTGSRGGVEELLVRLDRSLIKWDAYLKEVKPSEIVLMDAGDSVEGFENTGSQDRTNDLSMTEQIRVWRRIFWRWMECAAANAPKVTIASVPSNHGAVRRGKAKLDTPDDDWGIEVLSQLQDIATENPAKYGHVQFVSPGKHSESLAIQLHGGKTLGLSHGHQVGSAEKLPQWWAGQSHGRTPVGNADILVAGHWHNLRVQTTGDDRWLFIAPTSDNGSDWFNNLSGHESATGVLTFTVDDRGWDRMRMC